MNFENQVPRVEKGPHFLLLEDIRDKMNALIDTRTSGFRNLPG